MSLEFSPEARQTIEALSQRYPSKQPVVMAALHLARKEWGQLGEAEMRAEIGVENIMWGSDYPHPEGTWPHMHEQMVETFRGLPDGELRAMLGLNAARVYGLDLAALERTAARIGPKISDFRA